MQTFTKEIFGRNILLLILLYLCISQAKSQSFHDITEEVEGHEDYRKAEFSHEGSNLYYFKYSISEMPNSRVMGFRFDFDEFDQTFKNSKILCTSVAGSDDELKQKLDGLDETTSSCIGDFNEDDNLGIYDGIIKLDTSKTKMGIKLQVSSESPFNARIFLRVLEKKLKVGDELVTLDQTHSIVPNTIIIADFRDSASKLLFYSLKRELQMYYVAGDVPYPERLFSGNVLLVYTNPNQVRQKYKNATTMVLLSRPFSKADNYSEDFNYEVAYFDKYYLLDYFLSNNANGRSKNTPLMVNMTNCTNPYYVVLNYNQKEKKTALYIDQVYGKLSKLSVATSFGDNVRWDNLIKNMEEINVEDRYYDLPANMEPHIDVYKVECQAPMLLNFYYVDESAKKPELSFGKVVIFKLKSSEIVQLNYASGVSGSVVSVEIFNRIKLPSVIISYGADKDILISSNKLVKILEINNENPLLLRETGRDSNTRIIVKVGYKLVNRTDWEKRGNIYYNPNINTFVYEFPNEQDRLNYTYIDLETKGKTEGDNIKYCFAPSIGAPINPSAENCYRVSLNNPYTLKFINPLIMYRDYDFDIDVGYYISIKPVNLNEQIDIIEHPHQYDTKERNLEGEGKALKIESASIVSSILTPPENKVPKIFIQVAQCSNKAITISARDGFSKEISILNETTIEANKKDFFAIVNNSLLETELTVEGDQDTKVFIKHCGIGANYIPKLKENRLVTFNGKANELTVEHPLDSYEKIKYTVFIGSKGDIKNKGITLCSIAENIIIGSYNKTVEAYGKTLIIPINFERANLKPGQAFEAIVYEELQLQSKMAFLSNIIEDIVGDVPVPPITEIKERYDDDVVYATGQATSDGLPLYFTFTPEEIKDVPVGAFRIEFENEYKKSLSGVYCAFVDVDAAPSIMIEEVEDIQTISKPYVIGGKSVVNGKLYNYFFRYKYTDDQKPKKLVIKVANNQNIEDKFTLYLRKGENTYISHTNFTYEKTYGSSEQYEKTLMPYIVDLDLIRGNDTENYVSKLLIYSKIFDMQMYYLDASGQNNMPVLLFTGSIMIVYTNLNLAIQKYNGTKLILLSESINGQQYSALGNTFRFHTKMFRSNDPIEFFMSSNPVGRTLNYPLSLEINNCSETNKKYYYILNYNRDEDDTILYLDLVYGLMQKARAAKRINSNKWSEFIQNDMEDLEDMQITLTNNPHHIDVVEIECKTPLLANAYYNKPNEEYLELNKGCVAIKTLSEGGNFAIGVDPYLDGGEFVAISTYNSRGNVDCDVKYGDANPDKMFGNTMKAQILTVNPKTINIKNNNKRSKVRVIVKLGLSQKEWHKVVPLSPIRGDLYEKGNILIYQFPSGNDRLSYPRVNITVKPVKKGEEEAPNIKFYYSSSLGMAIEPTQENSFRTGENIHYTLQFVNPLVAPKIYDLKVNTYYVAIRPVDYYNKLSLDILELKYDIENRGEEGKPTVLTLKENENSNGIILSIPSKGDNAKIFVQLQVCEAKNEKIHYKKVDAYTRAEIDSGDITNKEKFFYYELDNNKMETGIDFKGEIGDKIFVKHIGITNTKLKLENYYATWVENKNSVNLIKPIKGEAFSITILIGHKGRYDNFSLCTFAELSPDKYKTLGDYVETFTSQSSDVIIHYVDFTNISDIYNVGYEFDLLVYAVQLNGRKLEILFDKIPGKVGKVEGIEEIKDNILDKKDYATHIFLQNITTSNYLFYKFQDKPEGEIAAMKIFASQGKGRSISKVACTFVQEGASQEKMIKEINIVEKEHRNLCTGKKYRDDAGFDALINAKDYTKEYNTLVILVKYGLNEGDKIIKNGNTNEMVALNITLRTKGLNVTKDVAYNENEDLTIIPYFFDLKEIRNMGKENYNSKVLLYSSTREMDMYYLEKSSEPKKLFSGNIMMVYTNEDVIKEKYNGASIMILLTDSLEKHARQPIGEKFRFKVSFFDTKKSIQYYVSANPYGRPLNNPTSIEMLSCDQPYYYILNYHNFEKDRRKIHIETIFGEINSTKFADQLNSLDWETLVSEMTSFEGEEYIISPQNKYHIDVFEIKCNAPLLVNIYYTDFYNPKQSYLKQGDVSIISLAPKYEEALTFDEGLSGNEFIYSFNVHRRYGSPFIIIYYEEKETQQIKENGIHVKTVSENYRLITVKNNQLTGEDVTKVFFKFGFNIMETFTKIENDMYNLQKENKTDNLFAYIFKNGEDRLNYTKVVFTVSTTYENVKFCYTTNLGTFISPSTQNCFRVGANNIYNLTIMNPYIMYNNYSTDNGVLDYYVSFKTVEKDLNITITPNLYKYDTTNRNMPDAPSQITVNNDTRSILTNPQNKKYLFVQMDVCTQSSSIRYEFKNAFSGESLQEKGEINYKSKNKYKNILNTKLDTEIYINTDSKDVKMFVRHTGIDNKFQPNVKKIEIEYKDKKLNFTQPITGEEFDYSILIDKRGKIKDLGLTLCDFALGGKKAYYTAHVISSDKEVTFDLDVDKIPELKGYEDFEVLILAEEKNNGKMMILSEVYSPYVDDSSSGTNTTLIVIIVVLSIVCIAGGIAVFIYVRKLKNKPKGAIVSQPSDVTDIEGAESGQKLVESMAQSVAVEHQ